MMSNMDLDTIIEMIKNNAKNTNLPNCVSKELTDQQAYSIFVRAEQLMDEGENMYKNFVRERKNQIAACYKYRNNQEQ